MAFRQVEHWEAYGDPLIGGVGSRVEPLWQGRLRASGWDKKLRRGLAATVVLLLHLVLLWLIIDRFAGGTLPEKMKTRGETTLVLELSGEQALDRQAAARLASLTDQAPVPPNLLSPDTPLDLSTASTFRPEWSVARISAAAVPTEALPPAPAPSLTAGSSLTGSGVGLGAGGAGEGYDPYAGAAPMRRDERTGAGNATAPTPGYGARLLSALGMGASPSAEFMLDQREFNAVVAALHSSLPGVHGSVDIEAKVSVTGQILEARIVRQSGDSLLANAARAALLGRRLFVVRHGAVGVLVFALPQITS
jgi:hypothetical protein